MPTDTPDTEPCELRTAQACILPKGAWDRGSLTERKPVAMTAGPSANDRPRARTRTDGRRNAMAERL